MPNYAKKLLKSRKINFQLSTFNSPLSYFPKYFFRYLAV